MPGGITSCTRATWRGLRRLLEPIRTTMLEDLNAAFGRSWTGRQTPTALSCPIPKWHAEFAIAIGGALRPGLDGWIDEAIALHSLWDDIDMAAVRTSVTWWRAPKDANAPLSAATRLVDQLPNAQVIDFGEHEDHLATYRREDEILDELLARG